MQRSSRFTRSLFMFFLLAGLCAGLVGPRVFEAKAAPQVALAASSIVISEFRTRGVSTTNTATDEFIELYNPTNSSVNIGGWKLRRSSGCGTTLNDIYTFPAGITLSSGQHYLVAGLNYTVGVVTPDVTMATNMNIADNGGVALTDATNTPIDQVGMCATTTYLEGAALNPLAGVADQSYEREVGGASGNCADTNANFDDFLLNAVSSNPQNATSAAIACIGVTNVSSTAADGVYAVGAIIDITITFSGIVTVSTVTGTPSLLLETGSTDSPAIYTSGSGSNTLTFSYTVAPGNVALDLEYVSTNSLSLNGGTIACATGDASLILPSPGTAGSLGANKSIVIDNSIPPAVTINQAGTQVDPASTLPINFIVVFSEPINASTFTSADITQNGTATGITWGIADSGDHMNFTLSATAVTVSGTLAPFIAAGQVNDGAGNGNPASTSTDNTVTYTPAATSTSTPTSTGTPTHTPGPATALDVLINEVAWMGTSSTKITDDWIELYNTRSTAINLDGWRLTYDTGTGETDLANFSSSDTIPAGGYFLLARSSTGDCTGTDYTNVFLDVAEDKCFTQQLADSGPILRLYDASDTLIDTANSDGGSWPAGSSSTRSSMERRGKILDGSGAWVTYGGSTSVQFAHNRDNVLVKGTPKRANWFTTITPTPTRTKAPPTKKPTAKPIPPVGRPILNEFLPRPGFDWNQDGRVDVFDEFIEIMNVGPVNINIGGWKLDDEEGQGSEPFTIPSMTLAPGQRVVFYGSQTNILLSDGGDSVRLLNSSGTIMDAYTYGIAKVPDQSWCRLPDGYGSSWYSDCVPTTGLPNTRKGTVPSMPPGNGLQEPLCQLPDTLPEGVLLAECNGYGTNIWSSKFWDEQSGQGDRLVPENESKQESFVE